jgi:hypothetical protein
MLEGIRMKKIVQNKHQKLAQRRGEPRVNAPELSVLLEYARSEDTAERRIAAELLCPCHLRKPSHDAAAALKLLMVDPDLKVRRQAWHTLEDGGPTPEAQEVATRIRATESDHTICSIIDRFFGRTRSQQRVEDKALEMGAPQRRGKCDFCGQTGIMVTERYDIDIPTGDTARPAAICNDCARAR